MTNQLAAVSPSELVTAQMGVLEHCVARINKLNQELDEAQQNLDRAHSSKWATKPFRNRVNQIARKIDYFKKIGEAVKKGYLIIPDVWNSELFAIRVKDKNRVRWDRYGSPKLQRLPIGTGEYVDGNPLVENHCRIDGEGRERTWKTYSTDLEEIDFPVTAVHPAVLDATEIAMADKIFDTFRIARQGGDPFIFGEIRHPTTSYKSITFFVAWFLDVNTL